MDNHDTQSKEEIKRLDKKVASLEKEIKGLRNQYLQLNSTISNIRHQMLDYNESISQIEDVHKAEMTDLNGKLDSLSQQENEYILRLQTIILIAIVFAIAFIVTLTIIGLTGLGIMQLESQTVNLLAGATIVEAASLIVLVIAYLFRKPPTNTNID